MKKSYVIEIEETKAETVVNLLAQINVKVGKATEEKKHYIKMIGFSSDDFACLTEEQFNLLRWLSNNDFFSDWEEVNPNEMFQVI